MLYLEGTCCCGIKEVDQIGHYRSDRRLLKDLGLKFFGGRVGDNDYYTQNDSAFLLFSTIGKKTIGERTAALIQKEKLGTVSFVGKRKNPNSGNMLSMWVWAVNIPAYQKWCKKNKVAIDPSYENEL